MASSLVTYSYGLGLPIFSVTPGRMFIRQYATNRQNPIQDMSEKLYKLRSHAPAKDKSPYVDLDLEFDGERAFVVWDSVNFGNFQFKARVEIDPALLQAATGRGCDYFYRGQLILPRPEHN